MEYLPDLQVLDRLTAVGTICLIAVLIITDKLVWHTRFKKVQERADRWERVALEALSAGAQAGIKAAETTVGIVSVLPDPGLEKSDQGR